jgi:hypothetical protein
MGIDIGDASSDFNLKLDWKTVLLVGAMILVPGFAFALA